MEYPHGQEKLKSRFTTTATVGIGKKCTKQTNMTLAKTRSLPYSNGTPTAAQTATTVPKRTTTMALLVTLAAVSFLWQCGCPGWGLGRQRRWRQRWMTTLVLLKSLSRYDDDSDDNVVVIIAACGR